MNSIGKNMSRAAFAVLAIATVPAAHAWDMKSGDWSLNVSGTVNGFYVHRESDVRDASGNWKTTTSTAVENGLLPAWLNITAATQLEGWDIKAHFGFAPGINSRSDIIGLPSGADPTSAVSPFTQIDTRNAYFSLGNGNFGTVKFGRDIGIFGQDVILSDMTILGVGGNANAAVPFNTTFGMISHGYMYVGFQPQITYTSPNLGGLSFSAGIFHPSQFAGTDTKSPGFQANASWSGKVGDGTSKLWTSVVSQDTSGTGGHKAEGAEVGGKFGLGPFEGVLYGFNSKGLGASTVGAMYFLTVDAAGQPQKSRGYFAQATFKVDANKFGISYGENKDDKSLICGGCDRKTPAATLGVYHTFNKYITFTGELVRENIKNDGVTVSKISTVALGAILFF
jgi:predicted porin